MVLSRLLPAMLISLSGIQKDLVEEHTFIAAGQSKGGYSSDNTKDIVGESRDYFALRRIRSM
jgi:hypothetical protein